MIRKIVHIDEDKCNGCGLCVPSCAEGAIQIIDGKAKLVKDQYCDGLGACLGECPMDAIHIIEREADEFDEAAAMEHVRKTRGAEAETARHLKVEQPVQAAMPRFAHGHGHEHAHGGCPGSRMRIFDQKAPAPETSDSGDISFSLRPQLEQWPVQLHLVPITAPYFKNADLLITADCVPFAYPDYHPKLLKGRKVVIGCPKLDDIEFYVKKLTAIIESNDLKSITVAFMEVPCCSGIMYAAEQAVRAAGADIPVNKVRISLDGEKHSL